MKNYLEKEVIEVDLSSIVINAGGLGKGEIEAMVLYKQISADKLLIDDRRARVVAEYNNIDCIGVLGVIQLAKHSGLINKVKPYIERLRQSSIYYGEDILKKALHLANEN